MRKLRASLSYANVMSSIAVFMVLGGSAYAATALKANSVGASQIKTGAVRSSEVKNGSLLSKDFNAGQLKAGPTGRDRAGRSPRGHRRHRGGRRQGRQGPTLAPRSVSRESTRTVYSSRRHHPCSV